MDTPIIPFRILCLALFRPEGEKAWPHEPFRIDKINEASFSEERIYQFTKAGIIPLVSMPNQDIAFILSEATVAAGSLAYQLFVFRIIQLFLWCKDHFEEDLTPSDLEERLKKTFSLFWGKTGQSGTNSLKILVKRSDSEKLALIKLRIEPSRQILPSGEPVEMEFPW